MQTIPALQNGIKIVCIAFSDMAIQASEVRVVRLLIVYSSQIMGWVRATISFSIVRATNLCLRGSRVKWRSGVGMEDGAGIPSF